MKDAATKSYSKKGQNIVDMNHAAIERGAKEYHKVNVPESWKNCTDDTVVNHVSCSNPDTEKYVNDVLVPANKYKGNQLPVSTFVDMADGTVASGSAAYEKRGVAIDVPEWNPDKLHPVQLLLVCLPACRNPSGRADRGRGCELPEEPETQGYDRPCPA